MCRTLPASCSSRSAPIDSSSGMWGSGRVELVEVDALGEAGAV